MKDKKKIISIIKKRPDYDFYIETNGTIKIEGFNLKNAFYVIDWKAPSAQVEDLFCTDNLKNLRSSNDIIKLVIKESDFDWTINKINLIKEINKNINIYVSPQWSDKINLEKYADFIIKNKLPVNLSLQTHKIIWDKDKRGV